MTTTTLVPTWDDLATAEPRLAVLFADARAVRDDTTRRSFCANAIWYGYAADGAVGLKERLCRLVGWNRRGHPVLGTGDAYDVAYEAVYQVLPNCRNCLCG